MQDFNSLQTTLRMSAKDGIESHPPPHPKTCCKRNKEDPWVETGDVVTEVKGHTFKYKIIFVLSFDSSSPFARAERVDIEEGFGIWF